jgi:hypothetical protein
MKTGNARLLHLISAPSTDADREYACDRQSHFGKIDKALETAVLNKWAVVDMKKDWKRIFAFNSLGTRFHYRKRVARRPFMGACYRNHQPSIAPPALDHGPTRSRPAARRSIAT